MLSGTYRNTDGCIQKPREGMRLYPGDWKQMETLAARTVARYY